MAFKSDIEIAQEKMCIRDRLVEFGVIFFVGSYGVQLIYGER